jgi:hypothetical protein
MGSHPTDCPLLRWLPLLQMQGPYAGGPLPSPMGVSPSPFPAAPPTFFAGAPACMKLPAGGLRPMPAVRCMLQPPLPPSAHRAAWYLAESSPSPSGGGLFGRKGRRRAPLTTKDCTSITQGLRRIYFQKVGGNGKGARGMDMPQLL